MSKIMMEDPCIGARVGITPTRNDPPTHALRVTRDRMSVALFGEEDAGKERGSSLTFGRRSSLTRTRSVS
jgi:hypothetical protein